MIGTAMAGAAVGAGEFAKTYLTPSLLAEEAAAAQKARDERLSELRKGEIGFEAQTKLEYAPKLQAAELPGKMAILKAEGDKKVDVAIRSPRTMPAGSSEFQDGKIIATAPEKPLPQEQLDYYSSLARRWNAEADAIRDGLKYRRKDDKPPAPNIKVEKDVDGKPYMVDQNSGALGMIVAGTPAKKGESHWFSPDEPATPEGPPKTVWSLNGQTLSNGLTDLYPAMKARIGDQEQPGKRDIQYGFINPTTGYRWIGKPGDRIDDVKNWEAPKPGAGAADRVLEKATPKTKEDVDALPAGALYVNPSDGKTYRKVVPGAAKLRAAQESSTRIVEPDLPSGPSVDFARDLLSGAKNRLQGFGALQKQRDPAGFAAAKLSVQKAEVTLAEAIQAWQSALGDVGAARFRPSGAAPTDRTAVPTTGGIIGDAMRP
jgi:hypothetical protein